MTKFTKEKVVAHLVKHGCNEKEAIAQVDKHFAYAVATYESLKSICECITTLA
jgi:hypothetical protein